MRMLGCFVIAGILTGCGSDEGSGSGGSGAKSAGRGTVLAENEELVVELAADGEHVFWVSDQTLRKLPPAGGTPVEVGMVDGETMALDATHAYFAGGIRGSITKLSKQGGSIETIVTGEKEPTSIAVDSSGVYWANWSSYDMGPVADGSIARSALDGSGVTPLAESLEYVRGIALDADDVYFVGASDEQLYRFPKAGGTPVVIATGLYDPSGPVLDADGIYLRTRARPDDPDGQDAIVRASREGGDLEVLVSERYGIGGIGVHAGYVYYTRSGGFASCDRPSGVVRRVSTSGGTPTDVAVEQSDPASLAVDQNGVYWTNGSGSSHQCKTLVRAALP
jgi:hypothetical protein